LAGHWKNDQPTGGAVDEAILDSHSGPRALKDCADDRGGSGVGDVHHLESGRRDVEATTLDNVGVRASDSHAIRTSISWHANVTNDDRGMGARDVYYLEAGSVV